MVNFVCQLHGAKRAQVKTLFLGASARAFLDTMCIWTGGSGKQITLPDVNRYHPVLWTGWRNFLSDLCACMLSCIQLFATPWTVACQVPLAMELSRPEYWSRYLPDQGLNPSLLHCRGILSHWASWEALIWIVISVFPSHTAFCLQGFPGGRDGRVCLQCRKPGSNPWVGIPWRRPWWPIPLFLPGEFHGQRSLVGYSPWGHTVGHDWVTHTPHTHILLLMKINESSHSLMCSMQHGLWGSWQPFSCMCIPLLYLLLQDSAKWMYWKWDRWHVTMHWDLYLVCTA